MNLEQRTGNCIKIKQFTVRSSSFTVTLRVAKMSSYPLNSVLDAGDADAANTFWRGKFGARIARTRLARQNFADNFMRRDCPGPPVRDV